jgi:hypothetical protein
LLRSGTVFGAPQQLMLHLSKNLSGNTERPAISIPKAGDLAPDHYSRLIL